MIKHPATEDIITQSKLPATFKPLVRAALPLLLASLFGASVAWADDEEPVKLIATIAVPGNPLRDIQVTERVFFVMKEGKIVKNAKQ